MASAAERTDQMLAVARVLQGFKHPTALISQAREVDSFDWDWQQPPTVDRRWYCVASGYNSAEVSLLRGSLESIGLRCSDQFESDDMVIAVHHSPDAVMAPDGYWTSSLVLRRWPREVRPGWLGHALGIEDPVDVGIHLRPQDPQRFARFLRKQASWQTEANISKPDAAHDLGTRDAEQVRTQLIAGTDRPVRVAVAFTVRVKTREELPDRVSAVAYRLGLALADVRPVMFEHDRALESTSLTGKMDLLGAWRTLDCTSVASTGIFQPATVNHEHGAPLGTSNGMLVKLDPFDETLRTFGGLITGSVGSGKSFLLKMLLLGLQDVEKIVVEQSEPAEYAGIPGVTHVVMPEGNFSEQAAWLRQFISTLWETARHDPKPRLLVLDELWAWIKRADMADLIEEIARRGRKFWLALWIATQQIEELLESAKAVFDNAAVRIYLQQEDRDLSGLARAARLSAPGRQYLRGAGRGQALLYVNGMLVPVQVQATPAQYGILNTDPRERIAA